MGLLGLSLLLLSCSQSPTQPPPPAYFAVENDLRFDERYYDSLDAPPSSYSARTRREQAIAHQLRRLFHMSMSTKYGYHVDTTGQRMRIDSVFDRPDVDGPQVGFRNNDALMADVYRRIDSLKILEHIPLTPH